MSPQLRLLTTHFFRAYLHPDLGSTSGDNQHGRAAGVALLISPGLFATVLLAAKHVMTPFPNPADTALASLFDRVLFYSTSMSVLGLIALVQWDRLALDAQDANILGTLPVPTRTIVRAKWLATAAFAAGAAVLLNVLPAVIYPIVSIGRLDTPGMLVIWLAVWHFVVSVLAGAGGFLAVFAVREVLWMLGGARRFAAWSATVQALLVVTLVAGVFLLPPLSARMLRDGHPRATWMPPLILAGVFEEGGGRAVIDLPGDTLPTPIRLRVRRVEATYRAHLGQLDGSARRFATGFAVLATLAGLAAAWNGRRLPPALPPLNPHRYAWLRSAAAGISRVIMRRPEVRAGASFAARTLVRSQPHRLALAAALALGLAAGTVGLVRQPPEAVPLADAPLTVLSVQALLVLCLAAGIRAAVRRTADARAAWIFPLAWTGDRGRYITGVALASWMLVSLPVLALSPLYWQLFGTVGAVIHAAYGVVLALVVIELVLLVEECLPLAISAVPTDFSKAAPALAVPAALGLATGLAAAERIAPLPAVVTLIGAWSLLHLARLRWRSEVHMHTLTEP